ncbi:hypothetical protein [Roseovarius indicus]|uniref:Uncharacterized protein n=1 Tax=Roseovarius indicus TaxID=540747 RepID=A0A0T5P3B5_9RHOB|nr:hypothetical protein [Roseovarius indicus]KRS15639.1 hypothetical protein XM52_22625 [Roseovarius indicus]QEW27853.1 hypothetical protein RIdsm_03674 [Roseovarius indicus]SFE79229.1 hypothetical protein SAMN04488031_12213 [Roseovarius indicus]
MTQARNQSPFSIPHTRAGKITDETLDQITAIAEKAQKGIELSHTEACLMLLTAPQVCFELRQRRAAMDLISDCTDLDNVSFIHCDRAPA